MCCILVSMDAHETINSNEFLGIFDKFKHRGPDQCGIKLFCNNLMFGHNRLSIQDLLENCKQPMVSRSKRYHIVFKSEIYNANSLAQRYLKRYASELLVKVDRAAMFYSLETRAISKSQDCGNCLLKTT